MTVLQLVCLDVLPEGCDDDWACLCVHSEETCQTGVELELVRLVVKEQEDGTPHILVTWPLHLGHEGLCEWVGGDLVN